MQRARTAILTRHGVGGALKGGAAITLALLVAACAVSSPLEITSTGPGLDRGQSVALSLPEDTESLRGRFAAALAQALEAEAVRIAPDAPILADFSVAQSVATAGVIRGEGQPIEGNEGQDWYAEPRKERTFDKCEAQRLRATFVLYDKATGELAYRGSGVAIECDFDAEALREFADGLVANALETSGS